MAKNEICVIENIDGIDEVFPNVNTIPFRFHNFSNVESVHQQQCDNDLSIAFDEVYLQAMEQQALLWKPHNRTSICWSLFTVNENLLVNLLNPQMLKCIICWSQQASGNVLNNFSFIVKKGLIKYGKFNDITPMRTHVDNVHLHLLAKRKSILSEKAMVKLFEIDHN